MTPTRRAALCGTYVMLALSPPVGGAAPRVTIDTGSIVGASDGPVVSFKGIPYAKPPVGSLRWRAPQPVESWASERDATKFGPSCPQLATFAIEMSDGLLSPTSEDCLTLNVWAPAHVDAPVPVMVFIHGGANAMGSSARRPYSGYAFARDGVVLVSLNYRIGRLGVFAHPALARDNPAGEPFGNYGLLDQIAALSWVKRNIRAFGGDPTNVTVFGESAGANDILALMTARSAAGLFQKAIVESADRSRLFPLPVAEQEGVAAASQWGLPPDATAEQLRGVAVDDIVRTRGDIHPSIDGRLLVEDVTRAFRDGRFASVPLLIGTNSGEGSLVEELQRTGVLTSFNQDELATARTLYPGLDDEALTRALFRDAFFTGPTRWIARQTSAVAPTYVYRFSHILRVQRGQVDGAPHGSELPDVFDSWKDARRGGSFLSADDRVVATAVHECWVTFARTGAPACAGVPEWPRYSADRDQVMELDAVSVVRANFEQRRLDFIDRHFGGGR